MIIVQRKGKTILYDDNGHIAYFGENKHIAMSIKKNMELSKVTIFFLIFAFKQHSLSVYFPMT